MKHFCIFSGALALLLPAMASAQSPSQINPICPDNATAPLPDNASAPVQQGTDPAAFDYHQNPYPDFGFMVSQAEYFFCWSDQPIFRLKTDFPSALPETVPSFVGDLPFLYEDDYAVKAAIAADYLEAVKAYAFEGNIPHWDPFQNTQANWYHIPWLHSSPTAYPPVGGTEGFRGLIKEAPLSPLQISAGQQGQPFNYSVYAITLVNDIAAYTLYEMWKDPTAPDPRATDARYGGGFKDGAVFAKLLFTDAPRGFDRGRIPFLENPFSWYGYITPTFNPPSYKEASGNTVTLPLNREVHQVNLLQMDVMVRDSAAPETGWVLGTFAYNGQAEVPGAPAPADRSDAEKLTHNLIPVGLMWGNDPAITVNTANPFPPTETMVNEDLQETIITVSPNLPPQHLGWNGRLNGPADLNSTSCLSCHIMAQYPAITSLVPAGSVPDGFDKANFTDLEDWMFWFQNTPAATSTNSAAYSTDFSFQIAISLTNFYAAKDAAEFGHRAGEYLLAPVPISRGASDD